MHPGKETLVTKVEKEDVLKIYPPLSSLHTLAAEEVAKKITTEQVEILKEMTSEYEQLIYELQKTKNLCYS
jgi:DNA-binding GntR family transcriptional regulator